MFDKAKKDITINLNNELVIIKAGESLQINKILKNNGYNIKKTGN